VESFDPRDGLVAARTRSPLGGDPGASWLPEQQVDTAVAVAAYTSGAAHAAFADSERGRIAEGLVADFTIWDRDLAGEPASLRDARVLATIVAGRIEHAAAPIPLG
jgi:predicted amidohydrolase YtcJ